MKAFPKHLAVAVLCGLSYLPHGFAAAPRLALVIGNTDYNIANGRLPNARGDAEQVAGQLHELGFEVMLRTDVRKRSDLKQIMEDFIGQTGGREMALVYYSGHGLQHDDHNYLIPTQETISYAYQVEDNAISVDYLLKGMKEMGPQLGVVILDACRTNPFPKSGKGTDKGLTRIKTPSDIVVAYATEPGNVADDGDGTHSPYAQAIVKHLQDSASTALPVTEFFNRVGVTVEQLTDGKQSPRQELPPLHYSHCFRHCNDVEPDRQPTNSTRLTVNTSPAGALVRILNLASAYQPGLTLKPGRYQVEVTHPGYARQLAWLDLAAGEQVHSVVLEELKPTSPVAAIAAPSSASTNRYGINMIPVTGSCFQMGSPSNEAGRYDNERQHEVCVGDFKLGETEVTQGQWRAVMGDNPSDFKNCGDDCPVENVSWQDVQAFIAKLNSQSGQHYRLPSEAEWEYACRSGGKAQTYCGGESVDSVAWYFGNSGNRTHPVKQKDAMGANGLGFYDMSGNVYEWTGTEWQDNYDGSHEKSSIDHASDDARLVVRGGSWNYSARNVRSASRDRFTASSRSLNVGFRLAQD